MLSHVRNRSFWLASIALVTVAGGVVLIVQSNRAHDEDIARSLTGGDARKAPPLLRRYGCAGCHQIAGLPGADGLSGPPLAGFRQRVFIAGSLPNNAGNLVEWIVRPTTLHPKSAMPETGISEAEARDVAAYLYLK